MPPAVAVLGQAGLTRSLVERMLEERGHTLGSAPAPHQVTVLTDPGMGDWEQARASGGGIVLVVEQEVERKDAVDAVLNGADAVVASDADADELAMLVTIVSEGGTVLNPELSRAVADAARARGGQAIRLTRREQQILESIDAGHSVKQTARALGISGKTVENLQSRLFKKLCVRNRAQAIARAHALGVFG